MAILSVFSYFPLELGTQGRKQSFELVEALQLTDSPHSWDYLACKDGPKVAP